MEELIKKAIRKDWENEICNDWESGMDELEIAQKHSITAMEVIEVLTKHNKNRRD